MKYRQGWLAFGLCLSSCLTVNAQDPTFTSQSRLVVVPVTISNPKTGQRLFDLQPGDFKLLDNGKERKITVEPWGAYESRVSLVVVVETSFLSDAALVKIRKMAGAISDIAGENGEIAVLTADQEVKAVLDFTKQWEPLEDAFQKLHASTNREGHVLDGLSAGVVLLAHRPANHRRVILLLCEGHDRGSHVPPMEVLTHAEQENVIIYTASYSPFLTPFTVKGSEMPATPGNRQLPPPLPQKDPARAPETSAAHLDATRPFEEMFRSFKANIGRSLAIYTGGRELNFTKENTLVEDLQLVTADIHSAYQISFVPPTEKTAVYHKIEIEVKDLPEDAIRARPGYWTGLPTVRPPAP